ncbi:uncharacterized protein LOC143548638 [Bidens hawaiensis]|uniref:uncharacterized protein LOC143548638 n=1 Tax=Bidens hawaiensis TaxID=980011 RepID=UPI00404A1D64
MGPELLLPASPWNAVLTGEDEPDGAGLFTPVTVVELGRAAVVAVSTGRPSHQGDNPISDLIDFVYPCFLDNFNKKNFFHERAILAPKNDVQEINDRLLSIFPGDQREYLSSDSICPTEMINQNLDESLCSPDILNGIKASGLPNHKLILKVRVPVMLLRNLDKKSGMCNGTRLKVVSLGNRVIQVEIISGSHIGDRHYIPRITLIPIDKKLHIKLQRRQFPLVVCFAMTINKSQ